MTSTAVRLRISETAARSAASRACIVGDATPAATTRDARPSSAASTTTARPCWASLMFAQSSTSRFAPNNTHVSTKNFGDTSAPSAHDAANAPINASNTRIGIG